MPRSALQVQDARKKHNESDSRMVPEMQHMPRSVSRV